MKTKILDVKNLNVSFKTHGQTLRAVRGISFNLYEGERLGIVGESGCGKSALVKSLVRLLPQVTSSIDEGEIWYRGENLVTATEKRLQTIRGKEIGLIFQDPMTSLNPTMKIGAQIAEGFLHHNLKISAKEAKAEVLELLSLVGVPEPRKRIEEFPHTLSGGLRQRVMIALALASQPKILIADEPTTSLDVTVQAQILDLIQKIQLNKSTILITHDLSVVAGFCDRVLVMYAGKIVEEATTDQLFQNPKHPYTRKLLKAIPRLDLKKGESLLPILGSPPDLTQTIVGCEFCPRCDDAMEICTTLVPPLFTLQGHHESACWLYDSRRKQ